MPTEHEELLKMVAQFRAEVVAALTEMDAEIVALHEAITSGQHVDRESFQIHREKARKRLEQLAHYNEQQFAPIQTHQESH